MINTCEVNADNVCVYVTISVRSHLAGKISILSLNLGFLILMIYLFVEVASESKGVAPFLLLLSAVWAVTFGKVALWNIFGKEYLVINTKSVSYQHDYGFFRTRFKTMPVQRDILVQCAETDEGKGIKGIRFVFCGYDANDLPAVIYESPLPVSEADAERIIREVNQLRINKVLEDNSLPNIILN